MANAAWQGLIAKHMLLPGFEKMGIEVSEAERMSMLSGEHPSQVYYSALADPQTGEYRPETISSFLSQVSANPQYQSFWSYLNSQATLDRMMSKYLGMVPRRHLSQRSGGRGRCQGRQREPLGTLRHAQVQHHSRLARIGI